MLKVDFVALGDHVRAVLDRALHLPGWRPLHHHLRGDPPQNARGQLRAKENLHELGPRYANVYSHKKIPFAVWIKPNSWLFSLSRVW